MRPFLLKLLGILSLQKKQLRFRLFVCVGVGGSSIDRQYLEGSRPTLGIQAASKVSG